MNVLSVNEQSGKPYGYGVEDWKRELALLSRDLNPAILNINQQPKGAVEKVAEWIQHTWYYTAPVRPKIVRGIIARDMRVRRYNIWKSISNGEDKPEDLSDKSWRTLIKLRKNPAHKQKSEDSKRANASRVHFGRIGPSGVVGVKARLEEKFHRSPEPEEIVAEMRRNKGYAGSLHRKKEKVNIPARGGTRVLLIENESAEEDEDEDVSTMPENDVAEVRQEEIGNSKILKKQQELLEEQVFNHPAVLQMKQKLKEYQSVERAAASGKGKTVAKKTSNKKTYNEEGSNSKKKKQAYIVKEDSIDKDDKEEDRPCTSRKTRRRVIYD